MQTQDTARPQSAYAGPLTQSSFWSRSRKPAALNLVPMIDIFTVLVTFLLMTAVFSRITVLELNLPSSESTGATPPAFRLEVIVRDAGFEVTNGSRLIASIPKVDGEYDLGTLGELALALKRDYPDVSDASVLLERQVPYDYLIQVMDTIRTAEVPAAEATIAGVVPPAAASPVPEPDGTATISPRKVRLPLFTQISVGDAP